MTTMALSSQLAQLDTDSLKQLSATIKQLLKQARRRTPAPATAAPTAPPAAPAPTAPPVAPGGSWNRATATWYTSYPECCYDKNADQSECDSYSGCKYEGMFAAFNEKKPREWVEANNIVAFYQAPNSKNRKEWSKKWKNRRLRIRNPATGKTMDVTVVDTCDDGDCRGCCSRNANANGGFLIDLEKNTAQRFYDGGVQDFTAIEWQVI